MLGLRVLKRVAHSKSCWMVAKFYYYVNLAGPAEQAGLTEFPRLNKEGLSESVQSDQGLIVLAPPRFFYLPPALRTASGLSRPLALKKNNLNCRRL